MKRSDLARRPTVAVLVAWLAASCDGAILDPGVDTSDGSAPGASRLLAPERAAFNPVADMMQATCGTLDCHGQIGRNLRLYGARGLRLDPKGNSAEDPTSAAEYDQSYWSVIGLEPEITSDVVADHGANPERLTIFRKARGTERHKGNKLFSVGDPGDRCLLSWFVGKVDVDACKVVSDRPRPVAPDPAP